MVGKHHFDHGLALFGPAVVFNISVFEDVLVLHHEVERAVDDQSILLTVDQVSNVGSIKRECVTVFDDSVFSFGGDGGADLL